MTGPSVAANRPAAPRVVETPGGAAGELDVARRAGRALGPVGPGGAVLAMFRRDLAGGRLLGTSIILDIVYGVVNLLVFLFISRVLHHAGQQGLGRSTSYFDFVAVGLAFMLVAQVSCAQVCARIQEERRTGTLEVLTQAPMARAAAAVGTAAHPLVIGILRSAVYLALACLLLGVDSTRADWWGAAAVLLIGAAATSGVAIVIGAVAVTFRHGAASARATIVGLAFLSGTYFPAGGLPAILRPVSAVLPTRMAIDGLRAAITGGSWWPAALTLTAAAAVIVPASIVLFVGAVERAVRKGVLSHG